MDNTATTLASPMAGWAQVFLSLMLVLAVLVGTLWMLRKLQGGLSFSSQGLRVAGGLSLGGKERVVLLDVDGQYLLLGVAPGSVTLLRELDELPQPAQRAPSGVADLVKRWQQGRQQ